MTRRLRRADTADLQRQIATLQANLTTAHGTIAWHTRTINEADQEIARLTADLALAETTIAHLAKTRDGQADRLTSLRAEQAAEIETLKGQVLNLTVELHDAHEGDPDGRKLRAAVERADLAETTAKQDRRSLLDLELNQQVRIGQATADMRRELVKADAVIAEREVEIRKLQRDAVAEVHVLPKPAVRGVAW